MWLIDLLFGKKHPKRYHKSYRGAEKPKGVKIVYNVYTYKGRARDQLHGTHTDAVFSNVHKARSYAEHKSNKYHCPMLVVGVDSKGYDFDDGDSAHPDGRYGIISARLYENGKWRVADV